MKDNKDTKNKFDEIKVTLQNAINNIKSNSLVIPIDVNNTTHNKNIEQHHEKEVFRVLEKFDMKPKEIKKYLDRFIIKQEEAKIGLSVAICDHYNNIRRQINNKVSFDEYSKQNILLIGPTGVGKTYLIKKLANLIGVPFVKADATKYSATGYVGSNVEDLVRDLVKLANGDVELAKFGIVYIDEIDKIACNASKGARDISGRGVQINLLKLMEDSDVNLTSQTDMMSQFESAINLARGNKKNTKNIINTKNILFIVSGSFDYLIDFIKNRVGSNKQIGFNHNSVDSELEYLEKNTTADFIKFGFEPEFIGRLPIRIICNELMPKDLELILTNAEGSILNQYKTDFDGYKIKLDFTPKAISIIAKKAYLQKTGARGLMTVIEKILRNFKYELPSININRLIINENIVNNPLEELKLLLNNQNNILQIGNNHEFDLFIKNFQMNYGFNLKFTNVAKKLIIVEALQLKKSIIEICMKKFIDYPFGLNLIKNSLINNCIVINKKMVESSKEELSNLISLKLMKLKNN